MKDTKSGPWIAGAVVVSLLLGVAAWFLAISPTMTAAAETRAEAEAQVAQNDLTRNRLNHLKTQFEQIDTLRAELEGLRKQIPTDADLAEYRRQVAATAATHGVTVVALQTSTAAPLVQPAPAVAPSDAGVEGEVQEQAQQPTDAASAAPTVGLHALPVSIELLGTYPAVLAFLQDLQQTQPRMIAIASLSASSTGTAEAGAGKPATAPGDLALVVTGYLFALPEPADPAATPDGPTAEPEPLPVPDPAANPMVPLG